MVQTKAGFLNKKPFVWGSNEKVGILPYLTSFQAPQVPFAKVESEAPSDQFNFLLDYNFDSIHIFPTDDENQRQVEDEEDEEIDIVETLFKRVFVTIAKECCRNLSILSNLYRKSTGEVQINFLHYETLEQKYGQVNVKNYKDFRINLTTTNLHKIQKDVNGLIHFFERVTQELADLGTFTIVSNHIDNVFKMRKDEKDFLKQFQDNEKYLRKLRQMYKKGKKSNAEIAREGDQAIQEMKQTLEDELEYKKQERSFLNRWESARIEQNETILENRENIYIDIIQSMDERIELENRCHTEIHTFIEETRKDYMDEIQHWMETYEKETEGKELAIYNLKVEIEKITETHSLMKETYEQQVTEMEEWLEYKRKKKEEEERDVLELWAAIKIQAWWRGTMYRKKLGPYRKKKKGKKGKGAEKDKNKKKGKAKTPKK